MPRNKIEKKKLHKALQSNLKRFSNLMSNDENHKKIIFKKN